MKLTLLHISIMAQQLAAKIADETGRTELNAYAIPRGGVPAALAVSRYLPQMTIVDDPATADIFIDDIIDSGTTLERWTTANPGRPFYALVDKKEPQYHGKYIVFPWEGTSVEGSVEDNIIRLIQAVGDKPERGGLKETPARVVKAWRFWCSGYEKDPADVLKVFEDGAEGYDQMIAVCDIPIYSKCEHHMADIFGTATIAYIPNGKIVGLSKLSRLADIFARRLQVQERLTNQIANALHKHLKPKGVGVLIRARHMCMESRGLCQQGHYTVTTALRGVMLSEQVTREEFLSLARK